MRTKNGGEWREGLLIVWPRRTKERKEGRKKEEREGKKKERVNYLSLKKKDVRRKKTQQTTTNSPIVVRSVVGKAYLHRSPYSWLVSVMYESPISLIKNNNNEE